jgi:LDH2 family malate/lactate/ureidoglycolate dehydrogenase
MNAATDALRSPSAAGQLIDADHAREIVTTALTGAGLGPKDARRVAGALTETSLRGIDTHGLRLVPQYLEELAAGIANPTPRVTVVSDRGAGLLLDADGALGVVSGLTAAEYALERARRHGIAAVGVRNSNHFGAASVYTRFLADRGLIGLAVTSAASRTAPFNGVEGLFGTNPISVAAGRGDGAFVLDMATSQVCFGEIKQCRAEGRPLEPGWATDATGTGTLDPLVAHALSPLGGYKGQGLAMTVSLLGAVLTGSPLDWDLSQVGHGEPGSSRRIGHLLLALDPAAFAGAEVVGTGLADLLGTVRTARPVAGQAVLAPGDPQRRHQTERTRTGIPLDPATAEALAALAAAQGHRTAGPAKAAGAGPVTAGQGDAP